MSDNKYNITESEWKVMQVIWHEPYLTLGEIKKRLDETIVWDRTTIHTLIRRLKNKGVVGAQEARYSRYYPLVKEEDCLNHEMESILKRFFYSSPKQLMATLIKHEKFTEDDRKDLKQLLSEIEDMHHDTDT